jgi:hypothetical protein
MNRIVVLLLVALSGCAGKQPLSVECERRLVPINEPIEQLDDEEPETPPEAEGRQP